MEAAKKQNRGFEDGKGGASDDLKAMEEEVLGLKGKIKKLDSVVMARAGERGKNG